MLGNYFIPANEVRVEDKVLNSRFIGSLAPALTVDAAKAFIVRIRTEFPDASHHVPAYLIGHGSSVIAHSSDDGEPSGTAGRPALTVLQGSGLGDVAIVVTRYFGGTKLGTGGLVRAYTNIVKSLVTQVPRAKLVVLETYTIQVPYALFDRTQNLIERMQGEIIARDFQAEVVLSFAVEPERADRIRREILELSAGKVIPEFVQRREVIRPISGPDPS
jgi:uncharacterized YigZ family protein